MHRTLHSRAAVEVYLEAAGRLGMRDAGHEAVQHRVVEPLGLGA